VLLTVRSLRALSEDFRLLELGWPPGLPDPLPGQFVMVRTRAGTDPLWRRPLGVHDFRRRGGAAVLSLLFQVVGPTTRDLAGCAKGDTVDVLGPQGRGFPLEAREHWLVAGGRGLAPLF
jgi:dihydroorotate dehydrogenase electron transfer subunit